jgi:hypothetical protein
MDALLFFPASSILSQKVHADKTGKTRWMGKFIESEEEI